MAPRRGKKRCMSPGPLTNNGYLNFLREFRQQSENCSLSPQDMIRHGAQMWGTFSVEQKRCYKELGPKGQEKKKRKLSHSRSNSKQKSKSWPRSRSVSQQRSSRGRSATRKCSPKRASKSRSKPRSKSAPPKRSIARSISKTRPGKCSVSSKNAPIANTAHTRGCGTTLALKRSACGSPCCPKGQQASAMRKSRSKSVCGSTNTMRKPCSRKSLAANKGFLKFIRSLYRRVWAKDTLDNAALDWFNLSQQEQDYWHMLESDSESDQD